MVICVFYVMTRILGKKINLTDEKFESSREREMRHPKNKQKKKSFFHKTSLRKKKKKLRVHTHIIKKNNFQGSQTRARELERERERERLNEPGETVGIVFYFARKNIEFKREHKSSTHF